MEPPDVVKEVNVYRCTVTWVKWVQWLLVAFAGAGFGAAVAGTLASGATRYDEDLERLQPSDDRLETLVSAALAADITVESFDIVVMASEGSVRLNGRVDTDEERTRAGLIAADVDGVADVENQLTGGRSQVRPNLSDDELRRRVVDDLADAFPQANVTVRVEDAMVTLTGVVSSRETRTTLTEISFRAGALLVKNQLTVAQE